MLDKMYEGIEPIAIVGMAGRFPGAKNLETYWKNLCHGVESITFFTRDELLKVGADPFLIDRPNYVKASGYLEDIDLFDASFFEMTPREVEVMDPQHRLLLECAWNALENAGYNSYTYPGRIGIYAGSCLSTYLQRNLLPNTELLQFLDFDLVQQQDKIAQGNDRDYLTTRISYKLGLNGPSLSVNTVCSTSLVAVHLACQSLLTYQSDLMLAGGASIQVPQNEGYLYREGGITSPDGHCRAFDHQAQGTIFGNGVGLVVLKRLEDALHDGDHIYAIIRGSAINNDGASKVSYTAPSVSGQAATIAEAQAVGEISPETITYIEAHGTGTTLGDPIEITALTQVFQEFTSKKGFCAIGSVKTNIGHLNRAAGIAGLIKTALALKNKQIPPSINFEKPNPAINFENSPFYVNTSLQDWQSEGVPRRAGVSAFGFGGTNSHVVLEEAPILHPSSPSRSWQLLVLSAKTATALEQATQNLTDYLQQYPENLLADVAYTLQVGRHSFKHRRIAVCQTHEEACLTLQSPEALLELTSMRVSDRPSVTFMFSGQGSQYVNMGLELYQSEPVFQAQIDYCSVLLERHLGFDLRSVLYPTTNDLQTATNQLQQTAVTQPALFVIEYALAKLLQSWGIQPQAMIGHSIGEYVAACIAEVFSLEEALSLVAIRGQLMQTLPPGAMLAVPLPSEEIKPFLNEGLSIALINGVSRCVISGTLEAIASLEKQFTQQGIEYSRVQVSHAFHSSMMEPILDAFAQQVQQIQLQPPKIPYISNVTGTWITDADATDSQYWTNHLRQTVLFSQGIEQLCQEPDQILLEVGPGKILSSLVKQHPALTDKHIVLSSMRHPKQNYSDVAYLLTTLGKLWLAGFQIDWESFYADEFRHRLPLPTYPFELQRYWIDAVQSQSNSTILNTNLTANDRVMSYLMQGKFEQLEQQLVFVEQLSETDVIKHLQKTV